MGYNTEFTGQFDINPVLSVKQMAYLRKFSYTRRMKRDPHIATSMPDDVRLAVDLPIGQDACYFTGGTGVCGQDKDFSVVDHNSPPFGQPSLWCQLITYRDSSIYWNGTEKFSDYTEWLRYLIKHFFIPWDLILDGESVWQGEESDDSGIIHVKDNVVNALPIRVFGNKRKEK